MSSTLHKLLIFRVFAPEGESACKYSLIFWGRSENSDKKNVGFKDSGMAQMILLPTG